MRKYIFAYESEIIRGNAEAGRIAQSCPRHRQRATKKNGAGGERLFAVSGLAYCLRYHRVMSTLTEAGHQVHARVDDPSRQIASEPGNQHPADRHLICSRGADGARDRSTPLSSRTEFRRAAQQVRVHAPNSRMESPDEPAYYSGSSEVFRVQQVQHGK